MVTLSSRITSLALVLSCASSLVAAPATAQPVKPSRDEVATPAQDRLTKQLYLAAAVSTAGLGAGYFMDSNVLMGVGLGAATGTAAAYVSQDLHWIPTWIAEIAARNAIEGYIALPVQGGRMMRDMLGDVEFQRYVTKHSPNKTVAEVDAKLTGASHVHFPAWITSWVAYLWYNNLAKKAHAEALNS